MLASRVRRAQANLHKRKAIFCDKVVQKWIEVRWLHCVAFVLRCVAWHCAALRCVALRCVALHCIALHYIVLHCVTFQRQVFHSTFSSVAKTGLVAQTEFITVQVK